MFHSLLKEFSEILHLCIFWLSLSSTNYRGILKCKPWRILLHQRWFHLSLVSIKGSFFYQQLLWRLNRISFRWILVGCDQVVCRKNRSCMVDHYQRAYCVQCPECSTHHNKSGPVCGADGLQYESSCHLRRESCRQGKAIGVAYRGRCIGTLDSGITITN